MMVVGQFDVHPNQIQDWKKGCVPNLVEKGKWRNLLLTTTDRR